MKRIFAFLSALAIFTALCLPVSAADNNTSVEQDFTVLMSQNNDGKLSLILGLISEYVPGQPRKIDAVDLTFDTKDGKINLSSDDSSYGKEALENVQKGEAVDTGRMVRIKFSGEYLESYPLQLSGVTEITFLGNRTEMTRKDAIATLEDLEGVEVNEKEITYNSNFSVSSLMTVVDSWNNPEDGKVGMTLSYRDSIYSVQDEKFEWYYTSSNTRFYINDKKDTFLRSDGSEEGDRILALALKGEPIPIGSVVEVTWSGYILETFPPVLDGIIGYTFTGRTTSYTYEDIVGEISDMNEMREVGHPIPSREDVKTAGASADFTVAYCDSSNAEWNSEDKYYMKGSTLYLARHNENGFYDDFIRFTPDFDEVAVLCPQDDEEAAKLYSDFLNTGKLPQGTVVNIVWNGMINDSYPQSLNVPIEMTITSKKTEYTSSELKGMMQDYYDEFDIENPDAADVSNNPNTDASTPFAAVALIGMLAWCAAVVCTKKNA